MDGGDSDGGPSSERSAEPSKNPKPLFKTELPTFAAPLDDDTYRTEPLRRSIGQPSFGTNETQRRERKGCVFVTRRDETSGSRGLAMRPVLWPSPSGGASDIAALGSIVDLVDNVVAAIEGKEESSCCRRQREFGLCEVRDVLSKFGSTTIAIGHQQYSKVISAKNVSNNVVSSIAIIVVRCTTFVF